MGTKQPQVQYYQHMIIVVMMGSHTVQCPPQVRHAPMVLGPSVALANTASPHAEAMC